LFIRACAPKKEFSICGNLLEITSAQEEGQECQQSSTKLIGRAILSFQGEHSHEIEVMNKIARRAKVGLSFPVRVRFLLPRHLLNEVSEFQSGAQIQEAKRLSVARNDKRGHNLLEGGGGGGGGEGGWGGRNGIHTYRRCCFSGAFPKSIKNTDSNRRTGSRKNIAVIHSGLCIASFNFLIIPSAV
jgi:hypothetical protein